MTCHAGLASLCINGEAQPLYLDGVPDKTYLCGPCVAAATRLGMNPISDRRRVPRVPVATEVAVPEWRRRGLAKALDSWRVAS
jgi:hypothetical protein